jgi:hypothetical protein
MGNRPILVLLRTLNFRVPGANGCNLFHQIPMLRASNSVLPKKGEAFVLVPGWNRRCSRVHFVRWKAGVDRWELMQQTSLENEGPDAEQEE